MLRYCAARSDNSTRWALELQKTWWVNEPAKAGHISPTLRTNNLNCGESTPGHIKSNVSVQAQNLGKWIVREARSIYL
jgi:hypothetical protein